ncbi:MAG: serine hydrolase domain-containing protein [Thermodesulfobacteriota bacterium]
MQLINHLKTRLCKTIRVPEDLLPVTTFEPAEEAAPQDADMTPEAVDAIWRGVEELYRTGIYPGITFCLRRQGQVVLNRGIGHSYGNGPGDDPAVAKLLMTPDTPVCQYSASKAITAMLIHLLAERGEIRLSDPVARYLPGFGRHGKQDTTIYHIISHQGGIPTPPPDVDPEILFDHDEFIKMLCDLAPKSGIRGPKMAYHAITGGAVLGEVVRRVTGQSIREFLHENIQKPLGFRYFNYGVPEADIAKVATNYETGPPLVFPISTIARRALSVSWGDVVRVSNDPRFMRAIIPAANLVATADEMSQFFQLLLNGGTLNGVRIFDPETVQRAVAASRGMWFDGTMIVPMRYSAGLMLGADPVGLWGPYSGSAFGHVGFINIFCWADPEREIAVSLQTTGKSLIGPHLWPLARLLTTIALRCKMPMGDFPHQAPFSHAGRLQKILRRVLLDS